MAEYSTKVGIVGDFAVGKTSTVERFVNNHFSDKYLTTIGVKVDTKEITLSENLNLKLIIWDIAGTDRFTEVELAYLRGASGYILVADGTRAQTVSAAQDLKEQIEKNYGELPFVFLINKSDLRHAWELSGDPLESLKENFSDLFVTSAKTGDHVDDAILQLARMIAEREIRSP